MARRYVNPNRPVPAPATPVTDKLLDEARARLATAQDRVRDAENADPTAPGWDQEYAAADAAAAASARRVEALERLRAAQVERGGARSAAVKNAAADLKAMATSLAASRDQVEAAAAAHFQALAALVSAAARHNAALAAAHAQLAAAGLRVRDELVDEGQEHAEGCLDSGGVRAGGTDWTRAPAAGLAAQALQVVFTAAEGWTHPLAATFRYAWRPHETTARPDGLRLPGPADLGSMPLALERPRITRAPVTDLIADPQEYQRLNVEAAHRARAVLVQPADRAS